MRFCVKISGMLSSDVSVDKWRFLNAARESVRWEMKEIKDVVEGSWSSADEEEGDVYMKFRK